jgi:hypothetical protein
MSISSTFTGRSVWGNECVTFGTYTDSGAATEDNIDTKLHVCTRMFLQPTGAAVSASAPVINETFPVAGSAVTIRTVASETGQWTAFGDSFA